MPETRAGHDFPISPGGLTLEDGEVADSVIVDLIIHRSVDDDHLLDLLLCWICRRGDGEQPDEKRQARYEEASKC